jgi:hypothetical protein
MEEAESRVPVCERGIERERDGTTGRLSAVRYVRLGTD